MDKRLKNLSKRVRVLSARVDAIEAQAKATRDGAVQTPAQGRRSPADRRPADPTHTLAPTAGQATPSGTSATLDPTTLGPAKPSDPSAATEPTALPDPAFWALNGLHERREEEAATAEGAVMLVGSADLPDGETVAWQETAGTTGLLEGDWSDRAASFAALGHPVRLELLRHILGGTRTTGELAAIETLGTTGQLHHHLRQLLAAGWVHQSGRGTYDVPANRIVPLLASIVAAQR